MNTPDKSENDELDWPEPDLAKEFEDLSAGIRRCLFKFNRVQAAELDLLMQISKSLIIFGIKSYSRIPEEFVKANGAAMLHADDPLMTALKIQTSLNKSKYRLQENEGNLDDFMLLASLLDVLVAFRRKGK